MTTDRSYQTVILDLIHTVGHESNDHVPFHPPWTPKPGGAQAPTAAPWLEFSQDPIPVLKLRSEGSNEQR
jgi:hypothetical protein